MAEVESPRDILARVMDGGRKTVVPLLAEMLRRKGIAEIPSAEERRRYWQRALTVEQEQQLWAEEMARRGIQQLTPGAPETIEMGLGIAKQVFPDRFDMMTGEGRDQASAQAEWAYKHAQRGEPQPRQEGE